MADTRKQMSPRGVLIFLTVFFLICSSVGLGIWIPNFLLPMLDWSHMKKWRETPCTVLRGPAGEGDLSSVEFRYRYEYEGETHESGDVGASGFFESSVWTIKPGTTTVCYVNPRDPRRAVLNRDFDWEMLVWCAPLMFVIFPGFALILGIMGARRGPDPEPTALPPIREGAVVIEAERRRGCSMGAQFGCLLMFAGLGALVVLIPGFKRDLPVRLIYLAPLALGAFAMLRFLFRSLMTLFHPRLVLTVTPGQAAPGQTVEVRWENRGGAGGGKGFRIVLEGREETRGHRSVRSEPFATLQVFQGGPKDLRRGLARVTIPDPTMHSFEHSPCSILWAFRVFVERPRWPRDGEEYRTTVSIRKGGAT